MQDNAQFPVKTGSYGLRREALSPMETLAQSVSTIAPTTTPAATIPLVCALAGNGTWLAYVLATVAVLLVALCIAKFARYSASPGSLYTYASMILPPSLGATAAWSLLLAYVATGASVIGGFYHYGNLLIRDATGHGTSAALLAIFVAAISIWIAWRDVKISARLMLWIEAVSVSFILIVVTAVLVRHGWRLDWDQLRLRGMSGSGLRLGLVLALFSFVGFESATTLGAEARDPLKTIPRAVIQSALLAGAMFIACAYAEVLGMHGAGQDLGTSQAPMSVLAQVGGFPILGLFIDIGALVSMFAGTLACITAAARVLLLMSHNGLAHKSLRNTHLRNETPTRAIIVTGTAAVLPAAILAARGASGLDVYGWMGSLATYGFIVTYALVSVALPRYLRDHNAYRPGAQIIPWLACCAMLLALAGNLYPVPEGPYGKLPLIYLAYLVAGLCWFFLRGRNRKPALAES
ncbi:MAG TPA: APC family permease [Candidatus Acidoferrales bacterium]|jgi:amino acid transporter|nr:APC family permease [Candidatus Acidoferrales bacterium]